MSEKHLTEGTLALEENQRQIIVIEASEQPQNIKLRVAAYARVSSDSDDQINSFDAQNRYYNMLIASKENWQMVDIYADRGISGTSAAKRDDFQRLLADCRSGKIDRILAKSISRFARNTKECLEVIRELKLLGISVYFEKENIDTSKMSGEMMTAMFASMAQAESQSISGNMRWSCQKRMAAGTFLPSTVPYGYRLNGRKLEVEPAETEIIKEIFQRYLSGWSKTAIAKDLNERDIYTRSGKVWHYSTIAYVLSNEGYIGDSLWQKKYSTDMLPTKLVKNKGERKQYYVKQTHPAIIDRDVFQQVQLLANKRRSQYAKEPSQKINPLCKKIKCGCCNSTIRRKMPRTTAYWVCPTHDNDTKACPTLPVPEIEIQNAFLRMYYKLKHHGQSLLSEMLTNLNTVRRNRMLWSSDIVEMNQKISDISSQNQMLTELNQQGLIDPDFFISQSNNLAEQLRIAKQQKERLLNAVGDKTISQTKELIEILENGPDFLDSFDEDLFCELVEQITIENNEKLRFRLFNGLELAEMIEKKVRK